MCTITSVVYTFRISLCTVRCVVCKVRSFVHTERSVICTVRNAVERWEDSLMASTSLSQVFLHLSILESSIAWSKSALHARCRICRRKKDGEHMLLCDGCDRGHHMYCLKPPMKVRTLPEVSIEGEDLTSTDYITHQGEDLTGSIKVTDDGENLMGTALHLSWWW